MADPYYENVALLLPMNGANNGTEFVDYSPNRKSVTVYGNAHTETDQSKYYGSSGYFDGSGDYLTIPAGAWITFAGDFTIEAYVRLSGTAGNWLIEARAAAAAQNFIFGFAYSGDSWYLDSYYSSSHKIGTTAAISANTWTHVAFVRSGTTLTYYVGGYADSSTFTMSGTLTPAGSTIKIGAINDPAYFNGYIQDLRITNGVARYTSDFTPPAKLCGTISGTITGADGNPAQRTIIAVPRDFPSTRNFVTQSSAVDGSYSLTVPDVECSRIVLADETTLYNDIVDRVIPG